MRNQIDKIFYQRTYAWKPILYDEYSALTYAIGRSALEYSTVQRVFNEIAKRHADFKPRSFFDFGAGVGTGTWAASQLWKQSLYEYFLVDNSREMNSLSDLILRDGDANKHLNLKNIYYRQFLPASSDVHIYTIHVFFLACRWKRCPLKFVCFFLQTKYDLMLSAYALMELPNLKTRIETLLTLWNKCDGYLVLIEEGNNAGFSLINEARNFFVNHLNETKNGCVFAPVCIASNLHLHLEIHTKNVFFFSAHIKNHVPVLWIQMTKHHAIFCQLISRCVLASLLITT